VCYSELQNIFNNDSAKVSFSSFESTSPIDIADLVHTSHISRGNIVPLFSYTIISFSSSENINPNLSISLIQLFGNPSGVNIDQS
jgi:hypothetical protein